MPQLDDRTAESRRAPARWKRPANGFALIPAHSQAAQVNAELADSQQN